MIDGHIAFASSGIIVPGDRGYSLQKREFASAIFTHHDGNRVVEIEFEISLEERQAERIPASGTRDFFEPNSPQVGRRHIQRTALPTHRDVSPCDTLSLSLCQARANGNQIPDLGRSVSAPHSTTRHRSPKVRHAVFHL
jgi:hypothetical protein